MKKTNRQKLWLTLGIGFGIVFLSAFVTSQILFPILFGRPKNIEVPELVNMSLAKARRQLTDLGLHVVVTDSIWSETDPIEMVLEQDPEPGRKLKPESTVYLRVSRGSKQVGVPSLVGLTYQEAYYSLLSAGLKGTVADSLYSDSYAANSVIRCSPSVGSKVEKGTRVRIYLSRGPAPAAAAVLPDSTLVEDPDWNY